MYPIKPKSNKVLALESAMTQDVDYNFRPHSFEKTLIRPLSSLRLTEFADSSQVHSDTSSDYIGQKFVEAVTAVLNNDQETLNALPEVKDVD